VIDGITQGIHDWSQYDSVGIRITDTGYNG
jgi:hypothetical protein